MLQTGTALQEQILITAVLGRQKSSLENSVNSYATAKSNKPSSQSPTYLQLYKLIDKFAKQVASTKTSLNSFELLLEDEHVTQARL